MWPPAGRRAVEWRRGHSLLVWVMEVVFWPTDTVTRCSTMASWAYKIDIKDTIITHRVTLWFSWALSTLHSWIDQARKRDILFKVAWVIKIRKAKFLIMKLEKCLLVPTSEALESSIACSGYIPPYVWHPGCSTFPNTIYSTTKKSQLVTNWQYFEEN